MTHFYSPIFYKIYQPTDKEIDLVDIRVILCLHLNQELSPPAYAYMSA